MSTLAQVIRAAMEARLSGVRVAMPARVESYDASTQKADVKPLLLEVTDADGGSITESLPVVTSVPVAFPSGGGFFVSLPLAAGDTGLLVICDRSIDQWLKKGGEVDPLDRRMHALQGAVFYPGLHDDGHALADAHASDLVIGLGGGAQLHLTADSVFHLTAGGPTAADAVALASKVEQELTTLKNAITNAVVVAQDGGASLKATILTALAAWPGSVGSDVVKAD